jgi:hypothetical protein
MERIDVSSTYVHLTWSLWFFIYLMACLYGLYTIWTDLREDGGQKESWIMFGLVLTWLVLAVTIYKITESV